MNEVRPVVVAKKKKKEKQMKNPFMPWDIWEECKSNSITKASMALVLAANYRGASKLYSDLDASIALKNMSELQQQIAELHKKMAEEYERMSLAVQKALSPASAKYQETYSSENPE